MAFILSAATAPDMFRGAKLLQCFLAEASRSFGAVECVGILRFTQDHSRTLLSNQPMTRRMKPRVPIHVSSTRKNVSMTRISSGYMCGSVGVKAARRPSLM